VLINDLYCDLYLVIIFVLNIPTIDFSIFDNCVGLFLFLHMKIYYVLLSLHFVLNKSYLGN
jgi:hypothetical protein